MPLDPFLGEIIMFGGNFEIFGFASCNGQLLSIAQNTALFSLIGTYYGGDGVTSFGLPDLRGRVPINQGQGPGLSNFIMGQNGGTETVTLLSTQMPQHTHTLASNSATANSDNPTNNYWAAQPAMAQYAANPTASSSMKANALGNAGGNQPHNNMEPYLIINYEIALQGIYPSRN